MEKQQVKTELLDIQKALIENSPSEDYKLIITMTFLEYFECDFKFVSYFDVLNELYEYYGLDREEDIDILIEYISPIVLHLQDSKENIRDTEQVKGYIYVLINPSLEGLVKIGKTTRDPLTRVNELSSATGIPTPFTLVYKEMFSDCTKAENMIHRVLEERGHRVSSNREFFNIPVYEVISLIQEIKSQYDFNNVSSIESHTEWSSSTQNTSVNELIESLIGDGNDYLFGLGGKLEDLEKGTEKLEKAIKLGSAKACFILGEYFKLDNKRIALKYFVKGSELDGLESNLCLGKMAEFYSGYYDVYEKNEEFFNAGNALKCWGKYLNKITLPNTDISSIDSIENLFTNKFSLDRYLDFCTKYNLEVNHMAMIQLKEIEQKLA
ncbi:GIY-YIG nuclease family protein [Peribacillus frigoritolerans]|uniref:GIY-YIG nuclease family protein n=1 Tax=Peribacillus frigoritolerans TaxID=450367 RepID=UPI0020BFE9A4|nr:GIY-YIG nuclease family protein [Peribacillus frigoritolerans]